MEKEQEYLKQQILELFPQYGINTNIGNYLAKNRLRGMCRSYS